MKINTVIRTAACSAALAMSLQAHAQDTAATQAAAATPQLVPGNADIVVTARRRDELLQDVPQTINVVTAEELDRQNIRNFQDIQTLVPGLTLSVAANGGFATSATVRGVAFNPEASGNNATVEFYLNDAPIASQFLFNSTFDIGQFELLRGPQGTLRGRASPSGSITVTTRRPNLDKAGLSANVTVADTHSYKGEFALNIPVISEMLAVRIAGVVDENDGNLVRSIKEDAALLPSRRPFSTTRALRATARFEPTNWLAAGFMYQTLELNSLQYPQVASATFITGAPAIATPVIRAFDRRALDDTGTANGQLQRVMTWNADVLFARQKLSYVGSHNTQDFYTILPQDNADFFAPPRFAAAARTFRDPAGAEQVCAEQGQRAGFNPSNQSYVQCTHGTPSRTSHELRLASDERIGGVFDYVVGGFYDRNKAPSRLTQETAILAAPTTVGLINLTAVERNAKTTEKSVFGNITAYVGERLELSGGLRYIDYKNFSSIVTGGTRPTPDIKRKSHATIYNGSAKYSINDDLMVYASVGSSWRPGAFAVGDFNLRPTARETSFIDLPAEKSTSYEAGVKASFLDKRARINLSVYQQDFDNYVYRGPAVFFVNYAQQGALIAPAVNSFNFVAAVPARVRGFELEAAFSILRRWSVSGNVSYADGKIRNGRVACTDLNRDGVPDTNAVTPTLAVLQGAVGAGENIAECRISARANFAPKWGANLQSEADFGLSPAFDGFLRGLVSYTPSNGADPQNTNDDVSGYALVNLFTGLRDPEGDWELSFFAKNILKERKVISAGSAPLAATTRTFTGSLIYNSDYYSVTVTRPREFGVNLRVALGSR